MKELEAKGDSEEGEATGVQLPCVWSGHLYVLWNVSLEASCVRMAVAASAQKQENHPLTVASNCLER